LGVRRFLPNWVTLKPQKAQQPGEPVYESRLPKPLARMKHWLVAHHMTLMTIADSPHSIALGSAIGIFFGFTPLYPLKTLLSIAVAWVLPVQQNRRRDCSHAARCLDLGDAGDLCRRISFGLLEFALADGASLCIFANSDYATTCTGMFFHGSFGRLFGRRLLAPCFSPSLRPLSCIS
jgi:hypothetical protein